MEINQIYNCDIIELLKQIPNNSVDMIFSDPDYGVGIKYNGKKYLNINDEYFDWYIELARESYRVLKPTGNIFFVNYPKQNAILWTKYLKDFAFGVNEYVWIYNTNIGHSLKKFTNAHRSILHVTKSKNNQWFKDAVIEPYLNMNDKRIQKRIENGSKGRMPYSWIYENLVKNTSREKTNHPCQIPINLYKKFLFACTKKDDLVLIHFGGSGGEIVETVKEERNFISAELVTEYCQLIRKRLLTIGGA